MLKLVTKLFLIFLYLNAYAQEPIRFSTKQGLPSNHVYDMQEDANGFMWFATNRGLVKYDGENFRTFTIKDGLPNNDTWLLETDYQDRLWYFSKSKYQGFIKNDSIYKFPVENNVVISPKFIHKTKEKLWLHSSDMHSLQNDTLKRIGFNNEINWENYFKAINKTAQKYNFEYQNSRCIPLVYNNEILCVKDDEILIFDKQYILKKRIPHNQKLDIPNLKIDNSGLIYNKVFYFALKNGVLFLDLKNYTAKSYSFKQLLNTESIKYFRAKGLKNEVQISIPGYLLLFDYNLNFKKSYAFSEELSKSSYQDTKGNIWLADFTNGVSLIPNTQLQSYYYLKNKKVQKINKIDNEFFAGVNDDGFYKLKKNTFDRIEKLKRQNGEIYDIKKNKNNDVLFISSATSFIKQKNVLKQIVINPKPYAFNSKSFKCFIHFNNNIYTITGDYVLKLNDIFYSSTVFYRKTGLLVGEVFKNQLFFGGTDGLLVKNKDTLIKPKATHNLLKVSTTAFLSTKENLFVGTDGRGVYSYNDKKVTYFKNTDGYSIQRIIKKDSLLWLATNNGVHQLTIDKNNIEDSKITNSFYEADGLLQNNINDIYLDKDTLYAASDIGLVKLNAESTLYQQKPKLYFKNKSQKIEFANEGRENISLTFALQDFVNQDNVSYQYRLLPNQKKWTSTQTKTINFSNLNPNSYTLQVKATDQHKNESIAIQNFRVVPFWYETILAKIGFILLGALLFLLVLYSIKKRIQLKETEKAEQEKRVAGLELQALRSQMNPHFVHNSLNAIQYFIQRKEVELSENYLSKFSTLIRLFFEYSRRKTISIQEEADLLEHYLSIEKLRFEDKLTFKINIDDKLDETEQQIPSMILQPIVENAVNHGLFHKKENGKIVVSFIWLNDSAFKVVIKDDGIGIKKAKEIYKSSAKNYRSSSTDVLKERFKLLEQSNTWKIKYTIIDLSEKEKKEGTEVSITFIAI